MFGIINECYHMLKGSLLIFIDYEVRLIWATCSSRTTEENFYLFFGFHASIPGGTSGKEPA